jgi:F-type H+-transporting ATPase subunit b
MSELMKDPMSFYSIAFVIFLLLAFRYGRAPLLAWIDGEILKIREELGQAQKLRVEAEATLAEYSVKQALALAEAEAIVRNAVDEAVRLKAQAETDLTDALARHEEQALERVRLAEIEAISDVRTAAIELAIHMARTALSSNLDEATTVRLADQAIADLPKDTATKAKAA